ncbi:centrosomal protein of 290 kDa-like isoform X2 [Hemicordylus capensis]|uniref:centrosomal protein of 290 kDa-like isoform X2 n=1 Tax=Hemicordylus capensis TaxID=884348 RepID=UPI0023047A7B|nr:centrosomal protein of 290 kDa-like isoform X2 [Hemicordylus capensis]
MALPSIHRCLQLNQENQQLLKRLRHVRLRNKQLEYDLAQLQDQLHGQKKLMPLCVTKRDVPVQTDMHRGDGGLPYREQEIAKENARVLQMYKNLQKRYNKELKSSQEQSETIATLSVKINDLEYQLKLANKKVKTLGSKKTSAKGKTFPGGDALAAPRNLSSYKCLCERKGSCSCKYLDQLLFEIQHLKMENESLSKERRMLRNELAALDKDFFDEIEDLKYALQEAIKLNNQYEQCFKHLSSTYGITFTTKLINGNNRAALYK